MSSNDILAAPILRPFRAWDEATVMGWFEADKPGLERMFGVELPSKDAFAGIFARLFEAQQQFQARLLVVEQKNTPIGFMILTDIDEDMEHGKGHMFIVPKHRRHSLAALRAGLSEARQMGLKSLYQVVPESDKATLRLSERVGFKPTGVVTLKKQL